MDITCARSPDDQLTEADLDIMRNRLEGAVLRRDDRTCLLCQFATWSSLFWEAVHVLGPARPGVGRFAKKVKKRLRKLVKAGRYVAVADGLDATHTRKIKQGRLPAYVADLLKSPSKAYRVSVRDREDARGQPVTDAYGVVLQQFKQGKSPLRHGDRIVLFHAMKHLYLDKLAVAGGKGASILRTAKRNALKPESMRPRMNGRMRHSRSEAAKRADFAIL